MTTHEQKLLRAMVNYAKGENNPLQAEYVVDGIRYSGIKGHLQTTKIGPVTMTERVIRWLKNLKK